MTHQFVAASGYVRPEEGFERARMSVRRALDLDPKSSLAHEVLAAIQFFHDWDWAAAEENAKEALRLRPRDSAPLETLGELYGLLGRWDESTQLIETALGVDPLDPDLRADLSSLRYYTGKVPEAESEERKLLQIDPTYDGGHWFLGYLLLGQGKFNAALSEMQLERRDSYRTQGLALVYHAMGHRAAADAALAQLIKEHARDSAYAVAQAYAYRRELDQAFAWLECAYRQKDPSLTFLKGAQADPLLYSFAHDSRFAAFLRKMNLPP